MRTFAHIHFTDLRRNALLLAFFWLYMFLISWGADYNEGFTIVLPFALMYLGGFLIVRVIQSDSLAGSTAFWMTRPITREQLVCAKTAFIVQALFLPYLATCAMRDMVSFQLSGDLLMRALVEQGLRAADFAFTIAVLAAFTANGKQFAVALACSVAVGMLVPAFLSNNVARTSVSLSSKVNCLLISWSLQTIVIALAWAAQASRKLKIASVATAILAMLLFPTNFTYWQSDNFPWSSLIGVQATNLTLSVENPLKMPAKTNNAQNLFFTFQVQGLKDDELVSVSSLKGTFDAPGCPHLILSSSPNLNYMPSPAFLEHVRRKHPPETSLRLQPGMIPQERELCVESDPPNPLPALRGANPPSGLLQGTIEVALCQCEKLVDVPVSLSGTTVHCQGEYYRISAEQLQHNQFRISARRTVCNLNAVDLYLGLDYRLSIEAHYIAVLYFPDTKELRLFGRLGDSSQSFVDSTETAGTTIEHSPLRERLTGASSHGGLPNVRVEIYRWRPIGHSDFPFRQENYTFNCPAQIITPNP